MEVGHKYVSYNGFTETTVTTGRYVDSVQDGLYDGFINLGSFSCRTPNRWANSAVVFSFFKVAGATLALHAGVSYENVKIRSNPAVTSRFLYVAVKSQIFKLSRLSPTSRHLFCKEDYECKWRSYNRLPV